eukprot:9846171-Karenia_brevis.AAC.1
MEFLTELGAYEYDQVDNCVKEAGKKPIPCGWVDVNRGDATDPLVRCRWVVKETRSKTSLDVSDTAT